MAGDKTYADGDTISNAEAYELIEKDPDNFHAAAITPGQFLQYYRKFHNPGQDILHITVSSAFTAAFQSANLAAESFREEFPQTSTRIIDSKTAGGAQGLLALAARRALDNGMSLDEAVNFVERARPKTGGYMLLDTLRYVYRTGRMSKTAARIASLLNIRPINRMTDEGTMDMVGKVRKRSDGFKKLIEMIKTEAKTDELHFLVSHANAPEVAQAFSDQLQSEFKCLSLITSVYSPMMGYAVGQGALFVGFQPELDL